MSLHSLLVSLQPLSFEEEVDRLSKRVESDPPESTVLARSYGSGSIPASSDQTRG